eukprot:TRINITY_DN51426_c0_g1_i1.p1 TRINITY_DN51426_c0_g1~~TRINITY_DN51426_c0_g1_i1.p1  ORF type:complete len:318 (+),score=53.51 TRINITY_DN51426_c0_g1_i1:122-1075(+)
MTTGLSIGVGFIFVIAGVVPGFLLLVCVALGLRNDQPQRQLPLWRRIFPIYKIRPNHPMFTLHLCAGFFFGCASFTGMLETTVADISLDPVLCTNMWRAAAFFIFCFQSTVLWVLYLRASIFTARDFTYHRAMQIFRRILMVYSVLLPISAVFVVHGQIEFGAFGMAQTDHFCHLLLNPIAVYVFLFADLGVEVTLLIMFIMPLKGIISEERHMLEEGKIESQMGHDRVLEMENTGEHGLRLSLVLLGLHLVNAIVFVVNQLNIGWLPEIISTVVYFTMFFVLLYGTKRSWEWEHSTSSMVNVAVGKSLLRDTHQLQ